MSGEAGQTASTLELKDKFMTIDIPSCLGYVKGLCFPSVCVYGTAEVKEYECTQTSLHAMVFMGVF